MRLATCVALVLLVGSSTVATAQPARSTVFISATGFAAIEKAPTFGGRGVTGDDAGGTVAGGALGIGVHLTERVSARFEWSLTDAMKRSQDVSGYSLFSLGSLTSGTSFGFGPVGPGTTSLNFGTQSAESKRTTAAGFALLGYHLGAGRASIELLGGVGLLNQDVTTSYVYDRRAVGGLSLPFPSADLPFSSANDKNSSYYAVAVIGADIAVTLTGHAAIVPQVRAYALNGGLSVRPGVGLRWTF